MCGVVDEMFWAGWVIGILFLLGGWQWYGNVFVATISNCC